MVCSYTKHNITICFECGSTNLFRDHITGELICTNCGIVLKQIEKINRNHSAYSLKSKTNSVNPLNPFYADFGLSTKIDWQDKDHYGNIFSNKKQNKLHRLRKLNRRVKINRSREQNLVQALGQLSNLGSKLNLPRNVMNTGSMIYRKALTKNLVRGKRILDIVTASTYLACRQCQVLRTLKEMSDASGIPRKNIAKYYKTLQEELELDISPYPKIDYINRVVNRLGLLGPIENLSINLLEQVYGNRLAPGCNPSGVAAACVYISTKLFDVNITQNIVAQEAKVSEVTLRNRYKSIFQKIIIETYL